jgi:uncharacterized pyridoxamine 5'-phosphate oxidase family protein
LSFLEKTRKATPIFNVQTVHGICDMISQPEELKLRKILLGDYPQIPDLYESYNKSIFTQSYL